MKVQEQQSRDQDQRRRFNHEGHEVHEEFLVGLKKNSFVRFVTFVVKIRV